MFVSLFLLTPYLQAQDFWEQLPFPDTLDISCVAVNNGGHIFVGTGTTGPCVSDGVYRSTDSGHTWQHVLSTGTFSILTIGIDKTGHVYASSQGANTFWKSTDNGQTWQPLPFNSMNHITKFCSFGNDSLLIGCSRTLGAMLLRTYDGGITFDTLLQTNNHLSESVSDIAIASNGDIYIALSGWSPDSGGLVKSVDNGATWQYLGLQGYQVRNVEINAQGDVFIGARDMGTYSIYHDNPDEIKLLHEAVNEGLVLNSAGHIYAGTEWPNGIMCSTDNGFSFTYVNSGLPTGAMGNLTVDTNDFIYALTNVSGHLIYRTYNSTVTAIINHEILDDQTIKIYPNPATDLLFCEIKNEYLTAAIHLQIFNLKNQVVYESDINTKTDLIEISINSLSTGCYTILFNTKKKLLTKQFVKL